MFKDLKSAIRAVDESFGRARVLVVGDLMLDRYYWGSVERISPEAPVPVVHLRHETHAPGGAANVAHNLARLGCQVAVAGLVGDDSNRTDLLEPLSDMGVDTSGVLAVPGRRTTVKIRVISGHQQMLRIDWEERCPVSAIDNDRLAQGVIPKIKECAAIILSDYAKGVLSDDVCQNIITEARRYSIPVFVDPKGSNYYKYSNAAMIFPNRAEIAVATGTTPDDLRILFQKAELLRASVGVTCLAVTMGELGISVVTGGHVRTYPAQAREVFDVSGAGDTVIATWTAAFAAGLDEQDCACLANLAAGIVIGKVGTVPISRDDLSVCLSRESFNQSTSKICTLEQLQSAVTLWRSQSERVVFTNGCFDLLHVGHVTLLERAKREGSRLVVGLNSDRSVRALKGANRPIMGESERAGLLASMSSVDAVTIFHEETPMEIIRAIKPDVLVKGGDYTEDQVVGAAEVRSWGGRVAIVPLVEGRSTTKLLGRLRRVADVQQEN